MDHMKDQFCLALDGPWLVDRFLCHLILYGFGQTPDWLIGFVPFDYVWL